MDEESSYDPDWDEDDETLGIGQQSEIYDDESLQDWLKDVIETNSDNCSMKLRVKTYGSVGY